MNIFCIDRKSGMIKKDVMLDNNLEFSRQNCYKVGGNFVIERDYLNPNKLNFCTNGKRFFYSTRTCDQASLSDPSVEYIKEQSISKKPLLFFSSLLILFYFIISINLVYLIVIIRQQMFNT